jgi:hypothetical protein
VTGQKDAETKEHVEITFKGLFGRKQINQHFRDYLGETV